jgi:hypothetical protein
MTNETYGPAVVHVKLRQGQRDQRHGLQPIGVLGDQDHTVFIVSWKKTGVGNKELGTRP